MEIIAIDEMWNFQSVYKLYNGYKLYEEINVIDTPLFFWVAELIFHIFGANIVVFRLSQCMLMAGYFLLSYRLLKKLEIPRTISFFTILGQATMGVYDIANFPLIRAGISYNQMAFMFVILGMNLLISERFKKNYILQAIISILVFLTKQTIGIYYIAANVIYLIASNNSKKVKIKKCIQYIAIIVAGMLLFLFILFVNNNLYNFLDYAFGSISEFANENIAIEGKSISYLIAVVLINIIANILVIRKKCFSKHQEETIKQLFIFSIIFLLMAYPIFNQFHVIMAIYFSLINLVYVIYNIFKEFKEKICKIIKVINIGCVICLIVYSGYNMLEWKKTIQSDEYPYSWEEPFYGGVITKEEYDKNEKVIKYIENNEKNVIVLSDRAALYMVPLKRNNGDFDLPLKGNFGSQGEGGLIEKIKNMENTQFLIYEGDEKVYQEVEQTKEYVKSNMEYVGKIDCFDIYE